MTKFPLGALLNGEYCLPCNAEKGLDYICPGCKAPVILRRGEIKAPHFAHKPGERDCKFYDHPGEGEVHKMAKYTIADLLRKGKIKKVVRSCPKGCTYDVEIDYEEGDEVIDEYPIGNRYKVDVALINNGKIKYIFEVYNTHKTTRETPEPWFEIDANKFLKDDNVHCIRRDICYSCFIRVNNNRGSISRLKNPNFVRPGVSCKTSSVEDLFKRYIYEAHDIPDEDPYYD